MSTRCASGVSTVHLALSWNESLRLNANQAASTGSWSGDSDQLHMQVRSPKAADIRLDTEHAIKHERMSPTPDARPNLSGTEGNPWPRVFWQERAGRCPATSCCS